MREMRPENIDLLMRTTNWTIFKLNCGDVSHARSTDIKLQHAEQNVVKATYPIIRAVADLQQLEQPTLKSALEKLMDGVIPLTDTIQELEQSRRELYKNVLPDGWKGLLAKPDEKHDELFGNIETRLKDCQADTKLQEQVVEERAKEVKKLTDKPFVPKRKYCDFSGYQTASKWQPQQQQAKFLKNEKRFPKQNQGPVGKRSDRRRQGLPTLTFVSRIFVAGQVRLCLKLWKTLTSDPYVLDIIQFGVKLDFIQQPPLYNPVRVHFPIDQELAITQELTVLHQKQVTQPTVLSPTSYVSPIFATEKKDGSTRLILNLKRFNESIRFMHFKMESLQDVFDLMKPGVWMASIDLCDAYYTIPVAQEHHKYLTFNWRDEYYSYTCLPNGYAQAPYIFTKILKVPFGYLRKHGHPSVVYIDDTYLQGDSFQLCQKNVWATEKLLGSRISHLPGKICADPVTEVGISWLYT